MTRQDLIHKWAVYALALLPVWLLDSCILPRFPLFGVTPMRASTRARGVNTALVIDRPWLPSISPPSARRRQAGRARPQVVQAQPSCAR